MTNLFPLGVASALEKSAPRATTIRPSNSQWCHIMIYYAQSFQTPQRVATFSEFNSSPAKIACVFFTQHHPKSTRRKMRCPNSLPCNHFPDAPWNIYLHLPQIWPSFVGKYSNTMKHLGFEHRGLPKHAMIQGPRDSQGRRFHLGDTSTTWIWRFPWGQKMDGWFHGNPTLKWMMTGGTPLWLRAPPYFPWTNLGNLNQQNSTKLQLTVHKQETYNPQQVGVTIGSPGNTEDLKKNEFMRSSRVPVVLMAQKDTKGCLHVKITCIGLQDTDGHTNRTTFHQPTSLFRSISSDSFSIALKPSKWDTVYCNILYILQNGLV